MSEQKETNSDEIEHKQKPTKAVEAIGKQDHAQDIAKTIAAPVGKDVVGIRAAEEDVAIEWDVGDVILDLYEVKQVHRTGGMGLVYWIHHKNWNMELAVKSPRTDYFKTEAQKENFIRECETWIDLGLHPNIVSCYYVRTLGGIPRIFAEYVEGGSLKDWINDERLYEGGKEEALERILNIAIQSAWGLQYAHDQGLIHQDIKPANILMTSDGMPKITDFGLVKARAAIEEVSGGIEKQTLQVSSAGGTPAYWSPEQAENCAQAKSGIPSEQRTKLTRRTDIWSWAVSVLEMFVGEVIWAGGQLAGEVLKNYVKNEHNYEQVLPIPESMVELLRKCFDVNPQNRHQNFGLIIDQLKVIYKDVAGNTYPFLEPEATKAIAEGLNNRGVSLFELRKKEEAIQCWKEALEINRTSPETVYNLSLIQWREGKIDDLGALKSFDVCSKNPAVDSEKLAELKAYIHAERGSFKEAREELKMFPGKFERILSGKDIGWISCIRTMEGHVNSIKSISVTNDGWHVVSASAVSTGSGLLELEGHIRLWDIKTGQCIRTMGGVGTDNGAPSLSEIVDGRYVVSGSSDNTIRLWDLETGECVRTMKGHTSIVYSVSMSVDGRYVVSGSNDNTIRLWDIKTGECIRILKGHSGAVRSVSVIANGRYVVSGSSDSTIRLWNLKTGECIRTMKGHGSVFSISITDDEKYVLSGNSDALQVWNLNTGECIRALKRCSDFALSTFLSADGKYALPGYSKHIIRRYNPKTGERIYTVKGGIDFVRSTSYSADGRYAVSVHSHSIRFWDLQTGQCIRTMTLYSAHCVSRFIDDRYVLVGHSSTITLLDLAPNEPFKAKFSLAFPKNFDLRKKEDEAIVKGIGKAEELYRNGDYVQSFSILKKTWKDINFVPNTAINRLYSKLIKKGQCKNVIYFHQKGILQKNTSTPFSITADGCFLVSGCEDHTIRLWDLETKQCIRTFEGHTGEINSISITDDGRYAVSSAWKDVLRVWDIKTGQCIRTMGACSDDLSKVAFTADNQYVLSDGSNRTLRLWDLKTGECAGITKGGYTIHLGTHGYVTGHDFPISAIAPCVDIWKALSGNSVGVLRFWNLKNGECIHAIKGHNNSIRSICLISDGRCVVTGSDDHTLRLWDLETGQCIRTMEGHASAVCSVCVTADGRYAVSGGEDCTLKFWDLRTGQCIYNIGEGHTDTVNYVFLSSNGKCAVSGSWDKTLRQWELIWDLEFD